MHAWRQASPETRAELYADALTYAAGREPGPTLVQQASQLLRIAAPIGYA